MAKGNIKDVVEAYGAWGPDMSAGGLTIVMDDEAAIGEAVGRTLNLHGAVSRCSDNTVARRGGSNSRQAIRIGAASPSLDFCQKPSGYRAASTCGATSVLYAKSTCWYSCSQNSALS